MRGISHSAADSQLTFAQACHLLPYISSHVWERSTHIRTLCAAVKPAVHIR